MSKYHHYQALENREARNWRTTWEQVDFLKPYIGYLREAIFLAEKQKPVSGWRLATNQEKDIFEKRLQLRWEEKLQRRAKWKNRGKKFIPPKGEWVVLEDLPWGMEKVRNNHGTISKR